MLSSSVGGQIAVQPACPTSRSRACAIVRCQSTAPYTLPALDTALRRLVPPRRPRHRRSSASRTACRISSSSRCRRCSRCCAPSSTCRGRCSARWSASSTPRAASTQFAAGFVVDRARRAPVLLAGMALLAGGTLLAALAPGAWWLFPAAAMMGVGNGVFHPADFAILNASVDAAAPRPRVFDARRRRQPGLRARADRELRARRRVRLARWRSSRWASIGLVVLGVLATQRALLDVAARARRAHAYGARQPRRCSCSRRSCCASSTSCSRRPRRSACRRSCRRRSTPVWTCRSRSRPRRSRPICSAARRASSPAASSRRARRATTASRRVGLLAGAALIALVATGAVPRPLIVPLFVLDRLRARRDRPVARPDRAQRHAEGRGGPRLRFRVLGTRPRRDPRAGVVRPDARSRPRARDVLRRSRRC